MHALMIPTMQTDFSIITNVPLSVCLPVVLTEDCMPQNQNLPINLI